MVEWIDTYPAKRFVTSATNTTFVGSNLGNELSLINGIKINAKANEYAKVIFNTKALLQLMWTECEMCTQNKKSMYQGRKSGCQLH